VLKPLSLFLAVPVVLVGVANFAWVLGANNKYGGGALGGFVRNGHYYVGQHGGYTEVSRAIWEDIRVHELALFLGWPLVFGCFGYLLVGGIFPWIMGLRRGEVVAARVHAVRASGMVLAGARCKGSVAGVGLGFPAAIAIELYPAGLTVRVVLEPVVAILKEELTRIEVPKGRFGRRVEITHRSSDIQSPIALNLARTNDFVTSLGRYMQSAREHVD
jgi:hypothetical protein